MEYLWSGRGRVQDIDDRYISAFPITNSANITIVDNGVVATLPCEAIISEGQLSLLLYTKSIKDMEDDCQI
jgi:hypothetical protein